MLTPSLHPKPCLAVLVLSTLISFLSVAQSCLPDGITFPSQSEIDDFPTNYPGCTQILGGVTLVESTPNNIANLNGISAVMSIGGSFSVIDCDALTDLSDLDNLSSIGGGFLVSGCDALTSIEGPTNLTAIGGSFILANNPVLSNINSVSDVQSIGQDIQIVNCVALTSIASLSNVTSISGFINIADNVALTSLSGLDNINHMGITNLFLNASLNLSECHVQSICDYLAIASNPASVSGNASGCENRGEIEVACGLPIQLTLDAVILQWATAIEINNAGFYIERSEDGYRFAPVQWVEGMGTFSGRQAYEIIDRKIKPGVRYYYRLKQVDLNGAFSYSLVVSVETGSKVANAVLLYPNPANDYFIVSHEPQELKLVAIRVFNQFGQIIKTTIDQVNEYTWQIGARHFPSHTYTVECQLENGQCIKERLVVVR